MWLSRALRLASVAEKTVYTRTNVPTNPRALAEPVAQDVRTAAVPRELLRRVHGPDERHSTDGAEALLGDVERSAGQRHLPRQEHRERHGRVDVPAWPRPRVTHTHTTRDTSETDVAGEIARNTVYVPRRAS
jgi:hypothetical protein